MAVYDGFFDFDAQVLEATGKYDREYSSKDFTGYYGAFIGSGVCVYNNPDSMKVSIEGSTAWIARGYLFIDGYWLANVQGPEEDPEAFRGYQVILPPTGEYAVVARLDLARRLIELTYTEKADSYPNCLVLGYANPGEGTVTDTRGDISVCGEIDALGALSAKVQYAVNYIDNEIEDRLNQAQEQLKAQEERLNAEIARVSAQVDKLTPPAVGTVKFTASQTVGPEWLRCDGRFISEDDYPELVAALGKHIPSGDKFELISSGQVGRQITNGAIYDGRMWTYSYADNKLYGINLDGGWDVKEITLESTNVNFSSFITPTTEKPLCLSIVPHLKGYGAKLFLSQIVESGGSATDSSNYGWMRYCLIFCAEFTGTESSLDMEPPFKDIKVNDDQLQQGHKEYYYFNNSMAVPYVTSYMSGGIEMYTMYGGAERSTYGNSHSCLLSWTNNIETPAASAQSVNSDWAMSSKPDFQRVACSRKSKGEAVGQYINVVNSAPTNIFNGSGKSNNTYGALRRSYGPINVTSDRIMVYSFDTNAFNYIDFSANESGGTLPTLKLPSGARVFVDAGAYLWGKNIFMFFVGTGIIFSRTLRAGDFGYLDTTAVLGNITQFGYLDYSEDEGTLYVLGQDTANEVKLAKIVLNTLYDYANDGAWLPNLASDGVPAYIKAREPDESEAV